MRNEKLGMKNTKGRGFFALLAVIGYLFIVAACSDLFEPPKPKKTAAGDVGFVSLSIAGNGAGRTIMPGIITASLFDGYTLVFSADGSDDITVEKNNTNLSGAITLPVGTWDLVLTAYKLDGTTKLPLARGSVTGIEIKTDANTPKSVELEPIIESGTGFFSGTGTFSWTITLPTDIVSAKMTITPEGAGGTAKQTLWLADVSGGNTPTTLTSVTLNSGVYRVAITLSNGAITRTLEQYLHVYRNMESKYTDTFSAGIFVMTVVTSEADSGTGSLRQALTDAPNNGMIYVADNVKTITLNSALPQITKNLVIEGNGVVIKGTSTSNSTLTIASGATVNISRVHFTGSRVSNTSRAIYNQGTLNLESCIFSDNQEASGGAINNSSGTMTVKGCTFYGNAATTGRGGAINNSGTLTLTGNLFYGNTASSAANGPVVYRSSGTVTSGGYNVSDGTLVTGAQAGYTPGTGDKVIGADFSNLPISGKTFKLIKGSSGDALKIITALPEGYPTLDFYGAAISAGAVAGAVQASVTGSGYYVDLSFNNPSAGTVTPSVSADGDGLYTSGDTLMPNSDTSSNYSFEYWLVNGVQNNANPLTINGHAKVVAVFARVVTVNNASDITGTGVTPTPGTLRYALTATNLQNGDKINIQSGLGTIELTRALPTITKSIIIEGNGVTLTRTSSWTAIGDSTQLLVIYPPAVARVSRVYFKGGKATMRGGAIENQGTLTLESCIFSDNTNTSTNAWGGGAISNDFGGTLTVKGCTFYNNTSDSQGGAIYNITSTLTLTGNLFYGNIASSASNGNVVYNSSGTVTSGGYNVVDVSLGTSGSSSGFAAATGDTTLAALLGSNATTPFTHVDGDGKPTDFTPKSELQNVMPATPIADFPLTDFSGDTRIWPGAPGAVK